MVSNSADLESPDNRKGHAGSSQVSCGKYLVLFIQAFLNLIAYILIGVTVGVCLIYAFQNGLPLNATNLHIVLCVIGYHLLMAVAILSLSSESGFSAKLSLRDKRRVHTVLQVAGSVLALAGSFIKSLDKSVHFNTLHGKFALVAMVFTVVCLVNGLASLYAYEWRKYLPSNLSKLTHICFGIVALVTATVSLCYGFDKGFFRSWASDDFALALIVFSAIFTLIVIVNPIITFATKTFNLIKK